MLVKLFYISIVTLHVSAFNMMPSSGVIRVIVTKLYTYKHYVLCCLNKTAKILIKSFSSFNLENVGTNFLLCESLRMNLVFIFDWPVNLYISDLP